MLSKVLKAASKFIAPDSENRIALKGVLLQFCQKNNTLVVFTSHGCAIFKAELDWGEPHRLNGAFTIAKPYLEMAINTLNATIPKSRDICFNKEDERLNLDTGCSRVALQTMNVEPIAFDRIMDPPCPTGSIHATLNLNDLVAACAAFKPLGIRKSLPVCLQIGGDMTTTELSLAGEQIHPDLVELKSVRLATMQMLEKARYETVRH